MELHSHEFEFDGNCAECNLKIACGPCAACESMICSDCGVLTKDPSGNRVICISCARLIASIPNRPAQKNKGIFLALVILVLLSFAAMILSAT